MILHAFTDGASRGNPGDSGIGVVVREECGTVVLSLNGYLGRATNNVAEYTALLALLHRLKQIPCTRLIVHSDSELMVRQLNGEYRVKDATLKKYHEKVQKLIRNAPCAIELKHIPRGENADADRLANAGIDAKRKIRV